MTVDPTVLPGLLLLAAELCALAAVGFVIVRTALRQDDDAMALAQGLVVGPALWGLLVNFVMYAVPGRAGAAVGWVVMLALAAALAWRARRSRTRLLPQPRVAAGFFVAALALFWVALAARQQLHTPDAHLHLGLAAAIREGGFPPELPYSPGAPANYHYGTDLLLGALAPPVGPDLAFAMELLSAYIWVSLALTVATALWTRAFWGAVLVTVPLLLSAGAWTLVVYTPAHVVDVPVPAGVPSAGLRASLLDIYWPTEPPWSWEFRGMNGYGPSPPNLFKPFFVLAYALALVVLERAAAGLPGTRRGARVVGGGVAAANRPGGWPAAVTLAALVGFLGLADETVAPIVLALWAALEAAALWSTRAAMPRRLRPAAHAAAGPALAVLLLAAGGGVFTSTLTGMLTEGAASGLSVGAPADPGNRRLVGTFDPQPGGVGVLGLGPVVVAAAAALLARRDRLALALAAGSALFLLAVLTVRYGSASHDLVRFDGHARTFAVLALMVALSARLHDLRPRWRYAAGAVVVALVIWPTAAAPVRNLGLSVGHGVQVSNASAEQPGIRIHAISRQQVGSLARSDVAAFIRDRTAVDARVLSPSPHRMTFATGRPNVSGLAGRFHLGRMTGAAYRDAAGFLDPTAVRRLEVDYVHATDVWAAELPAQARRRLENPRYFDLLVRDGADALYRVRPAFLQIDAPPAPASYEALRQSVPASAVVWLPAPFESKAMVRIAASLDHARLVGQLDSSVAHLRRPFQIEPLGGVEPDLVAAPLPLLPWMFPPDSRQPVWWNDELAVIAPRGAVAPIMPPDAPPIAASVRVSDAHTLDGRAVFTATLLDTATHWDGQDWLVVAVDDSPRALPRTVPPHNRTPIYVVWFAGHFPPDEAPAPQTFDFDARTSRLAARDDQGTFVDAASSGQIPGPGVWVLAMRLRREPSAEARSDTAYLPVLRIEVSADGEAAYAPYEDPRAVRRLP